MRGRLRLFLVFLLCSASVAFAQNSRYMLEITPSLSAAGVLTVQPGEKVQFTAKAYEFTSVGQRQEVQITQLQWDLDPAAFGSIDNTGLLTVATQTTAPRGTVSATASVASVTLRSVVPVIIGQGSSTHTFKGNVSSAGGPIPQAKVSVMGAGMLPFLINGYTDAQGNFSIDVPAGTYVVRAEATGYLPEFYDDVATIDKAHQFVTDPNVTEITGVNFVLGQGGTIRGTVSDAADNSAIAGGIVYAYTDVNGRPGPSNSGYYGRTDANGDYEITGLPAGDYTVTAAAQKYIPQYYDGETDPANADKVTVAAGATVSDIDFALNERQPDPVYTIEGTVHDAASAPVEGAMIYAEMRNGPMLRWLQTRSLQDGSYSLEVPAGSFVVWAMKQGLVTEYYDNVSTAAQATAVTVDASTPTATGIDFSLGEGGVITGVVRDAATGDPIADASVGAFGDRNSNPSGSNTAGSYARTDANGVYRLPGLGTGSWYVQAVKDGYSLQFYDKVADLSNATTVAVVDGQESTGIDFALQQLPGISGKVTSAATGAPIQRAIIVLDGPNTTAVTYTDANGEYHLATQPGSYKVQCSAGGYAQEWYDNVTDPALATTVNVPQTGSVTGIDFALDKYGASIAGVVRDGNGAPVADAVVRAWTNGNPTPNRSTLSFGTARSDASGNYIIEGLPAADYIVRASAAGFLPEYYDDVADMASATEVTVASNQAVTGIDFSLGQGGSISGTITDEDTNDPLAGAVVYVRSNTYRYERGTRTDANGNFTVSGLASDDYTVFAAARGYLGEYYDDAASAQTADAITVTAPNAVTGIDMALAPAPVGPRTFRGNVVARIGAVPAFAIVEAINPETGKSIITATDAQGGFELQAWEDAVLRSRAIGYVGKYAGNTLNWKESRWEGLTGNMTFSLDELSETGMAEVTGRITDAGSGEGLADAWVYGMDAAGSVFFTVTGGDGGYLLEHTSNGSLDIMVSEVRYEPTQDQTTVEDARGNADISAQRSGVTGVDENTPLPTAVRLHQNYPNPFNPSTTLRFDLPARAKVLLRIYDLLGREVATLVSGVRDAGSHAVTFSADGLPSGLYFARLESAGKVQTRRMTLMK